MSLIIPANTLASGGFTVDNSCRFNSGSTDSLDRTPSSSGNGTTFTMSMWLKRSGLGGTHLIYKAKGSAQTEFTLAFNSDKLQVYQVNSGGAQEAAIKTLSVQRDISAWYHACIQIQTADGTATDRCKIYINGVQQTIDSSGTDAYSSSFNTGVNQASYKQEIGGAASPYGGYMAEFVMIDGSILAPTEFAEADEDSGIWKPKSVSGLTFGTNGFYQEYKQSGTGTDSSGMGADTSGNDNHFAVNNLTAIDQSTDTCTNNFATWNSLQPTNAAMSEGNLVGASSASSGHYSGLSTIGVTSGKWYFECKQIQESTTGEGIIGAVIFYNTVTALLNPEGRGGAWGIKAQGRGFQTDSGGSGSTTNSFTAGWSNNDTIGIALDIDNSRIYFSKGGQWNNSGSWNAANPTTSQTLQNALGDGTYFFMAGDASGSNNNTWSANFGSPAYAISSGNTDGNGYGNFEYAPPSGYFALNTKNLAEYG